MALNIKDPETERLAGEVAALTGRTRPSAGQQEERLLRFLEEEIWPLIPPDQLGMPLSKAEREEILGYGEHGA
jgi:antitoxin VapB